MHPDPDRRVFLRRGALGAGALWMFSLSGPAAPQRVGRPAGPGPLEPAIDQTSGLPLLLLPSGFRYLSYSWTGDLMSDGIQCPPAHDGMAVIRSDGSDVVLVRNHESGLGDPFVARPE